MASNINVRYGILLKQDRHVGTWRRRMVVIDTSKNALMLSHIAVRSGALGAPRRIPFEQISNVCLRQDDPYTFEIETQAYAFDQAASAANGIHILLLKALSTQDAMGWVAALNRIVPNMKQRRSQPSMTLMPVEKPQKPPKPAHLRPGANRTVNSVSPSHQIPVNSIGHRNSLSALSSPVAHNSSARMCGRKNIGITSNTTHNQLQPKAKPNENTATSVTQQTKPRHILPSSLPTRPGGHTTNVERPNTINTSYGTGNPDTYGQQHNINRMNGNLAAQPSRTRSLVKRPPPPPPLLAMPPPLPRRSTYVQNNVSNGNSISGFKGQTLEKQTPTVPPRPQSRQSDRRGSAPPTIPARPVHYPAHSMRRNSNADSNLGLFAGTVTSA